MRFVTFTTACLECGDPEKQPHYSIKHFINNMLQNPFAPGTPIALMMVRSRCFTGFAADTKSDKGLQMQMLLWPVESLLPGRPSGHNESEHISA